MRGKRQMVDLEKGIKKFLKKLAFYQLGQTPSPPSMHVGTRNFDIFKCISFYSNGY